MAARGETHVAAQPPVAPAAPQVAVAGPGFVAKAALFLILWSMLLIGALEVRMTSHVATIQEDHQRQIEGMRRIHGLQLDSGVDSRAKDPIAASHRGPEASVVEGQQQQQQQQQLQRQHRELQRQGNSFMSPASEDRSAEELEAVRAAGSQSSAEHSSGRQHQALVRPARSASDRKRRLVGFYEAGTTGSGKACFSFSGATTEVDMNSDSCAASGKICQGCFIATADSNDKVLEIIKCSTAKYKGGSAISGTGYILEIQIINADPDSTLTVKGCDDNVCTTPASTYVMNGKDSVVGFCYAGGSNALYFPTMVIQNSDTYTFSGKTITDLGTVQTAIIQDGSMSGVDVTVGASHTLDVSSGTLTLGNGQIAAGKIAGGAFSSGTYSFAGSTIASLGTVTTADIDGGTIDATDITVGTSRTLDVSGGTLTLANGQVAAGKVSAGTFVSGTYSFSGSTISDLGTVTTVDINGGTMDGVTIGTSSMTLASSGKIDVASGTLTLNGGQVQAGAVGAGTFDSGTYSFVGSTISNLGTVTTAVINGGTIDNAVIGGNTPEAGSFTTLDASAAFSITKGTVTASTDAATLNKQSGVITSSEGTLPQGTFNSITLTNSYVSTASVVVATAEGCTSGEVVVHDVSLMSGSVVIRTKNIGTSACSSTYKVHFIVI